VKCGDLREARTALGHWLLALGLSNSERCSSLDRGNGCRKVERQPEDFCRRL